MSDSAGLLLIPGYGSQVISLQKIPNYPLDTANFFCPECGEVWARLFISGGKHRYYCQPCEKHGHPFWAGALLQFDRKYIWHTIHNIPPAILAREIDLTLQHSEEHFT